jgi:hypothetical protein
MMIAGILVSIIISTIFLGGIIFLFWSNTIRPSPIDVERLHQNGVDEMPGRSQDEALMIQRRNAIDSRYQPFGIPVIVEGGRRPTRNVSIATHISDPPPPYMLESAPPYQVTHSPHATLAKGEDDGLELEREQKEAVRIRVREPQMLPSEESTTAHQTAGTNENTENGQSNDHTTDQNRDIDVMEGREGGV